MGDAVVVGGFFQYWFPDVPAWIPAIGMMLTLFALNVLTVKLFGEVEFWFAIIKIIAVVALISVSVLLIATSFVSPTGVTASLTHLLDMQAAFPNGLFGFFAGFQMAIFFVRGYRVNRHCGRRNQVARKRRCPKPSIPYRSGSFFLCSVPGLHHRGDLMAAGVAQQKVLLSNCS